MRDGSNPEPCAVGFPGARPGLFRPGSTDLLHLYRWRIPLQCRRRLTDPAAMDVPGRTS